MNRGAAFNKNGVKMGHQCRQMLTTVSAHEEIMDMTDKTSFSFFDSLRRLSVRVERGTKDLQDREEKRPIFHYHSVMKTITELRKDVSNLQNVSQDLMSQVKKNGSTFEEVTLLCQKVIEIQSSKHKELEEFLKQYGYTPCTKQNYSLEGTVETAAGSSVETESEEENEADEINSPSMTVASKCQQSNICKSPKLEDFGVSHHTVRMKFKRNGTAAQEPITVPSPFQHSGIVVTPSILGGRHLPMYTPDKSYFENSPCPPVFQTPGMTQILKLKPLNFQDTQVLNSPSTPDFKTPGAKQAYHTQACKVNDADRKDGKKSDDTTFQPMALNFQNEPFSTMKLEEPEEPELTVNLQALSQMTRQYYADETQMPTAPKPLSTDIMKTSKPVTPQPLELGSLDKVQHHQSPEVMQLKNTLRTFREMPKSPEFLLKYNLPSKENVKP